MGCHALLQMVKNLPAMRKTWVRYLGWEDPLEECMATHSSILAWRISMDRGAWEATVNGVTESGTTERLSTAHLQEPICSCLSNILGNSCFINQIIYNQKLWQVESKDGKMDVQLLHYIRWTAKTQALAFSLTNCFRSDLILSLLLHFVTILFFLIICSGGLPSMGSHRVRHNWSDLAAAGARDSKFPVRLFFNIIESFLNFFTMSLLTVI